MAFAARKQLHAGPVCCQDQVCAGINLKELNVFSHLKLGQRLALGFGAMAVLMLAMAAAALWGMAAMRASTVEINSNWLPSVELVNKMNTSTSDFRITEFQHVLNTDDKAMAAIEKTMTEVLGTFEKDTRPT